ncbi:Cytochrome P450 [Frankia sp. AiPs1]|uniref:cytochrome P450 n=1 Tax=Frankia sp. AiPa1 TaxID=573492 RepID=UPI00202B3B8A|nr:cytochrome P450 [Frankia sp. AiPa1]MCL9758777.1 cytochrome P450 [Frankia sp. AiPa1]
MSINAATEPATDSSSAEPSSAAPVGAGKVPSGVIDELVSDFDYTDPRTVEVLHQVLAAVRARSGAVHSSRFGGHWAVSRYEDIIKICKDSTTYSSAEGVNIPDIGIPVRAVPLETDPPEHTQYRRFLGPWFRKATIDALEPMVRRIVRACLEEIRGSGEADLVPALAEQVPSVVIAVVLGLPEPDWGQFRTWTTALLHSAYDGDAAANVAASQALAGYLGQAIDARRSGPDDGSLLHALANGVVNDEPIPADRALGIALLLLLAGHETTASSAASLLHYLADKPELREQLRDDPTLTAAFVHEGLRHDAPVIGIGRTVTCPHLIDGNQIAPGDKVLMLFAAANRDERVYSHPDDFTLNRDERPHLAFGYGIHRCLGEQLAILELNVIVSEVLDALPDYRLRPGFEVTFTPGITRGPSSLPVLFTPSAP